MARGCGMSASTDEASMVERLDVEVTVVMGSDRNIKITKPTDMELARLFRRAASQQIYLLWSAVGVLALNIAARVVFRNKH